MGRRKYTPWKIVTAWKGDVIAPLPIEVDSVFKQVIREIAAEETATWGSKHGDATIIMNLIVSDSDYVRGKRIQARNRYNELKREEKTKRETHQDPIHKEFS